MQVWADSLPEGLGFLGPLLVGRVWVQVQPERVWVLQVVVLQVQLQLGVCSELGSEEG